MNIKRITKKGVEKSTAKKKQGGDMLAPYVNKWVALSHDHRRVLASGKTLREVRAKIGDKERKNTVFHLVPDKPLAMYEI